MAEKIRRQILLNRVAAFAGALTMLSSTAQDSQTSPPPAAAASAPDTASHLTITGNPGAFDVQQMRENFRAAVLPIAYERAIVAGKTHDEATRIVSDYIPERTDFSILRHKNSTAIVTYNRDKGRAIVAFDATDEVGDVIDDLKVWGKAHPLGGTTHSGISNAQFYQDKQGSTLVGRVQQELKSLSAGQPVTLSLTGFSRGGAQATGTAANWIVAQQNADGVAPVPNAKLTSVYTFGGLPFGDKDFSVAYGKATANLGIEHWRVIGGDDSTQKNMTTEAWYGKDLYRHVGTSVYMLPLGDGGTEFRVAAPLTVYEQKTLAQTNWHDPNTYSDLVGLPTIKMTVDGKRIPAAEGAKPNEPAAKGQPQKISRARPLVPQNNVSSLRL